MATKPMVNPNYTPDNNDEEQILQVLKNEKRATPYLIREEMDFDIRKEYVSNYLDNLIRAGWVEKRTRGVYDLIDDPRDDTLVSDSPPKSANEELCEQLERAHDRIEDLESNDHVSATDECHEAVLSAQRELIEATEAMELGNGQSALQYAESALETLREVDV